MLHEVNVSDTLLATPKGYNVCLRVGGLAVKINFIPKVNAVGSVDSLACFSRELLL